MRRHTMRLSSMALGAAALLGACSERGSSGRATVRLSPRDALATAGLEAGRLVDRDTGTAVAVGERATVTLRFGRPVEVRRIKVHGARSVRVEVAGTAVGSPGPEGWASATPGRPVLASELAVAVEPTGPDAALGEIEAWGAGVAVALDAQAMAALNRAPGAPEVEGTWTLRASPSEGVLQPAGLGQGDSCLRARFPFADPRQARRASLVYEANVPRGVVLQHSFGGQAPVNGVWLGSAAEARTLLAEVDPERLRGGDEVLLCLPPGAGGVVAVTGLRLLMLLDDGSAPFDRETRLRLGPAVDGDRSTAAAMPAGPFDLGLDRSIDVDEAEVRLGRAPARLEGAAAWDGAAWREYPGMDLPEEVGRLPVTGRAGALRLAFAGPARPDAGAASVAELTLRGSGLGPRVGRSRIVLAYPAVALRDGREVGERFGSKAYLSGWAESPAGRGAVEIEGARVDVDGAFSLPLERPAGTQGSWAVTLRARFPDGSEATRTIHLDDDREGELLGAGEGAGGGSTEARFGRENQTGWGLVDPATGGKASLGTDVSVEVPPGAVASRTTIGITRKGHEVMPRLDAGMVNVTAPAHAAYRFQPKGQRFAKPVKVTIPYDPELLPDGVAPEEVQTYYFDEEKGRWLTLARVQVLRASRQIVSETTHFTFMVNAVLVLPDHPGPVSFNPNSIKDLKAADPSSGIDLVEPPQGNNQGTARLGFPIRLPRARGAHQPSLALAYDSGGGNGWTGVGWDLAVSRVSLDTRYGVPEYTGEERYLLDGEAVVPVAPPSGGSGPACANGSAGREYRARVQRDFKRIVRCGGDPTRYWFEVADKGGTLFVYGHGENARLASYLPRVTDPPVFPQVYDVAEWYLERVVDANGNLTQYGYQHDSPGAGDLAHRETFRQVYLRSIQYSGTSSRLGPGALEGGSAGPYLVELRHEAGTRPDVVTTARAGFKTAMRRRLGTVEVRLLGGSPSGLVRKYVLEYEMGDLGKSRLRRVEVRGTGDQHFHEHRFEYENRAPDQDGVELFGPPVVWTSDEGPDHGLSGTKEWSFGFHAFGGLGFGPWRGAGAVGLGFGYGHRRAATMVSFLDLNGDGLPDRVYDDDARSFFREKLPDRVLFNQGAGQALAFAPPPWDPAASAGWQVPFQLGDRHLGKESGNSVNGSLQAFYSLVSANIGGSYTSSQSQDFVLDANGDGLPDFVSGANVFFNQPRRASCPPGSTEAQCCPAGRFCFLQSLPVTVLGDLGDSADLLDGDPAVAQANRTLDEELTPEDAVLEWTAPYDGNVDVSGALAFAHPQQPGERRDGVRLSIFHFDPFAAGSQPRQLARYLKAPPDDTATPVRIPNVHVRRGEILYFVLSTLGDFPMNRQDGALSPVEQVDFAPVVTYLGVADRDRDLHDPSGARLFVFDAGRDFVLAGHPQGSATMPADGRVGFTLRMRKSPTSDEVRACLQYYPPEAMPAVPPPCRPGDAWYRAYGAAETSDESLPVHPSELQVAAGGTLLVRIDTDVAVDPRSVKWSVEGGYTCVTRDGQCRAPSPEMAPLLAFRALPYMPLHDAVEPWSDRWAPSGAPLKPFKASRSGTIEFGSAALCASRDPAIFFTVRTLDRLLFKRAGGHGEDPAGGIGYLWTSARLSAGDEVFFEGHTESAASLEPYYDPGRDAWCSAPEWLVTCSFRRDDGIAEDCGGLHQITTDRRAGAGFEQGNHPLLSGGFHGWRYGTWNGKEGEAFQGWVYRGPPKSEAGDWSGDPDQVVDRQLGQMGNENDPRRLRLRLLGFVVPSADGTRLRPDQPGLEPADPPFALPAFVSQDGNTYFTAGRLHAGRKGQSASAVQRDPEGTVAAPLRFQVGRLGRSSVAVTLSAGLSVAGFGGGLSTGFTQQKLDALDMNGDGILDVVVAGGVADVFNLDSGGYTSHVRLTSPASLGYRRTTVMNGLALLQDEVSGQINLGVSPPLKDLTAEGETRSNTSLFAGIGGGLAFNVGNTVHQLADVNGDGLPDLVRRGNASCGLRVQLNMGTSFARNQDCLPAGGFPSDPFLDAIGRGGTKGVRRSTTVTLQGTVGADLLQTFFDLSGGVERTESYGASVSAETSLTATNLALVDVTGDGLADQVYKANTGNDFWVRVNRGYDFAPPRRWHPGGAWPTLGTCPPGQAPHCPSRRPRLYLGAVREGMDLLRAFAPDITQGIDPLEATGAHGVVPSVSVAFNFAFPLLLGLPPWLHIGAGFSVSPQKVAGFELGLQDIDGDGLADQVLKTAENGPVWARLNQLGKANLLKRVVRPLGGSIDLAYEQRLGNTVDMPESRWVLTRVTARDGRAPVPGAPGHDLETRYGYENGRRDRSEREFLGFARVVRVNPDRSRVEQAFRNDGVLVKGLLVAERMLDREGRTWVETVNTWADPIQLASPAAGCAAATPIMLDPQSWCGSFFTRLTDVEKRFHEGQEQPGIVTRQHLEYDAVGNVRWFHDEGDLADPADDLLADVTYFTSDAAATGLHSVARPRSVEVKDGAGRRLRYRSATYDGRGNLEHFEADIGDGRVAATDLHWNPNGTLDWVKGPENATGQRYQTRYGYAGGATETYVTSVADSHGYASSAAYDERFGEAITTTDVNGNVTARRFDAFGRLDRLAGPYDSLEQPTVAVSYAQAAAAPYAWTRNRLPRRAGDHRGTVDTVVVMDGLGRVIQTKKTAEIATSAITKGLGWSVAGHQTYDVMGRVDLQGQAFASFSSRPEYVPGTPRNPTRFAYDVMGRTIQTVEPNGALTRVEYGFGTPSGALARRFKTTTTDAEGHSKAAYRDASDRVVAVEERIEGRTPTTHYQYGPVGELRKVVDAAGNPTVLDYDLLGRRTLLRNPDAGEIRFDRDPAGNLVRKHDPNLDLDHAFIEYRYDFDQLTDVKYPNPSRNVHYTYGRGGSDRGSNGIGRVVEVRDDAGREIRSYGKLGELTGTTRVLRPFAPGDRERTFATAFEYDSFGRMMSVTYPDGERVDYQYDAGGLLEKATGRRGAEEETYLASMLYDEFGQRVRMELGNRVVTSYSYEPLTRWLSTLTTRTPLGRTLQALSYGYDRVGNVATLVNALGAPVGDRSGEVRFEYRRDALYRLTWAHGEARSRPHTIDRFTASYAYSDIHNMTSNVQLHEVVHGDGSGVGVERPPKTNHDFGYQYQGTGPHQATKVGDTFLVHDPNGNTLRECRDQQGDATCSTTSDHLRRYGWTEENRLDHVIDGGGRSITKFVYDAAGDRIVKLGRGGESLTIGQFWSLKGKRAATKHVFAGASRLASKLLPPPGWGEQPVAGGGGGGGQVGDGWPNDNGCDPSNYQPQKCPVLPGGEPVLNHAFDDTAVRPETYYYHPDHLGSTSWVTDQNGRVHEHVEYFPYGEVWRDPRSDSDGGPVKGQRFLFTGKELDEETGLYYFGARYYHPRRARWLSPDPLYLSLPERGIAKAFEYNLYGYVGGDPASRIDPTGLETVGQLIERKGLEAAKRESWVATAAWAFAQAAWDYLGAEGVSRLTDAALGQRELQFSDIQMAGLEIVSLIPGSKAARGAYEAGVVLLHAGTPAAGKAAARAAAVQMRRGERGGTYLLKDPETGKVMRTGRSKDLDRRASEHARDPTTRDLEFEVDRRTDVYAEQRGREQVIHEHHKPPLDKINPISPTNPKKQEYMKAAEKVE